ncbi:hypothetical protein HAX54_035354 [Datura stramonium]|uniref:Uncharacterized protein n=1 Tax=Datura stramonium TaxID=4076 RepID=A0ABS8VGV1_DATST|nr:hypothetical protein [Datura stramonium]
MNGGVGELLKQSRHFGTLVHDMNESEECLLLALQIHEETSKQNLEVIWTWLQDDNISSIGIYVRQKIGCKKLVEVKKLTSDNAWELFRKSLGCKTMLCLDIELVTKSMARQNSPMTWKVMSSSGDLASLELLEEFGGWFNDLHSFNKFIRSHHNYEKDWWNVIFVGQGMPNFDFDDFGDGILKQKGVIVEDCTIEAGGGEAPTSIILPHCVDIDLKNLEKLRVCWRDEMEDIIASEKEGSSQSSTALHLQVVTFQS